MLNAHTVTVARWEAGTLCPDPWQADMLAAFRRVANGGDAPAKDDLRAAVDRGAPYGLQAILAALPATRRSNPPTPAAAPQAHAAASPRAAHGRA